MGTTLLALMWSYCIVREQRSCGGGRKTHMLVTSVAVVTSERVVEVVGTGRLVRLPSVPVEVPS